MDDNMDEKEISLPGEVMGTEEEYMPGEGVFCNGEGNLFAGVPGIISRKGRKLEVVSKNRLEQISIGSTVYGLVERTNTSMALVIIEIPRREGARFPDITPFTGLHVSHVKRGYLESIRDAVHIGDVIKAKVIKYVPKQGFVDISTEGKDFGVILAFCSNCKGRMVKIGKDRVKCEECGKVEERKLSTDYGNIGKEVLKWK